MIFVGIVNKDNEIEINKNDWESINKRFSKDEIKQTLSDTIRDFSISLPYRKITKKEQESDFNSLKSLSVFGGIKFGKVFTRYEYKYEISDIYIDGSTIGNKSSDYFHQQARWLSGSVNSPSPYRTWTIEKFRLTLFNALWSLKFKEVNNKNLRTAIALRKYIAGQFKPSVAKTIYSIFEPKKVFDPSAGWGDRMSGFVAYSKNLECYESCDPNTNIDYQKQIDSFGDKCNVSVDVCGIEDKKLGNYDFIFTSPPYYNIEKYSDDDSQSFKKFPKFVDWLNWFLVDYIKPCWESLDDEKFMVINISDVYSGHKINNICDAMNDYIKSLGGAYVGTIGLRMAKRPNSKSDKVGIFVEPMWVWKKGDTDISIVDFVSKRIKRDIIDITDF